MKIICFDTETTGLAPTSSSDLPLNVYTVDQWPHIVQLSYIIHDTDNAVPDVEYDAIIKLPEDVQIPSVCSNIHGITKKISEEKGIDISTALHSFINACTSDANTIVVAHNMKFDMTMIRAEYLRLKSAIESTHTGPVAHRTRAQCTQRREQLSRHRLAETGAFIQSILNPTAPSTIRFRCTMVSNIAFCNIIRVNSRGEYTKYPTLVELYRKCFQTCPENMHNSLYDARATLKCFLHLNAYLFN